MKKYLKKKKIVHLPKDPTSFYKVIELIGFYPIRLFRFKVIHNFVCQIRKNKRDIYYTQPKIICIDRRIDIVDSIAHNN